MDRDVHARALSLSLSLSLSLTLSHSLAPRVSHGAGAWQELGRVVGGGAAAVRGKDAGRDLCRAAGERGGEARERGEVGGGEE